MCVEYTICFSVNEADLNCQATEEQQTINDMKIVLQLWLATIMFYEFLSIFMAISVHFKAWTFIIYIVFKSAWNVHIFFVVRLSQS